MLRFLIALLLAAALLPPSFAAAQPFVARTDDRAGVHVVVTPKLLGIDVWEFEVTMDTHSKPLTVDLERAAVLIDDGARRVAPSAWVGDAPGGHHRKGVLRFTNPPVAAKIFELQIDGIGETGVRTFRWEVK